MKELKTNAMRILDRAKIKYTHHEYPHGNDAVDGVTVAKLMGQSPDEVFKTLVAVGASGTHYVFVVPVALELDLKKCAHSVGEKSVRMIHVKELTAVTGYVRGGCSPVGMKKQFVTVFHQTALEISSITVSAGRIGFQIELEPRDLIEVTGGKCADIAREA